MSHEPKITLVTTAATLARIDERSLHHGEKLDRALAAIAKVDDDVNGIGTRLTAAEVKVEEHKWALRGLIGAIGAVITGLVLWYLTTR